MSQPFRQAVLSLSLLETLIKLGMPQVLRKQPTFGNVTSGVPVKWRLRNELRNSIPMTCHYPDLGSASDFDRAATEICFYSTTQTQI